MGFFASQKIHALPLQRKTSPAADGSSWCTVEDEVERESWKDLLSAWRSRVSCLSAEIVHITADIRLSPIVEKIHWIGDNVIGDPDELSGWYDYRSMGVGPVR